MFKINQGRSLIIYPAILVVIIALAGIVCYYPIINSFFLSDDLVLIAIFQQVGPWGLWVNQQHGQSLFFRPVLSLISFLDYQIWGNYPLGYHLTNLGFHLSNALAVGWIASLLVRNFPIGRHYKIVLPYISGFVFLLLPSHTEAVSWISARTDVISSFFGFVAFIAYLIGRNSRYKYPYILSLLLFFMAVLSKESIVTFPGLIILFEIYHYFTHKQDGKLWKKRLGLIIPYLAVLAVYFIWRVIKIGTLVGGYGEDIHLRFDFGHIAQNLIIYPTRTFLPPIFNSSFSLWLSIFWLIVLLSLACTSLLFKSRTPDPSIPPLLLFLAGSFFVAVLPAINVFVSITDTQGERYLYFGSGFASIYLAVVLACLCMNIRLILVVSSILLLIFGLTVQSLNQNWRVAGSISQNILLGMLQDHPNLPAIITAIPDNYRGAYIYRTGLIQGLYLFGGGEKYAIAFNREPGDGPFERVQFTTNNIQTVMHHNLRELDDTILIRQDTPEIYQFNLSNPETSFLPWPKNSLKTLDYEVIKFAPTQYQLLLKNPDLADHLIFYSDGRLTASPY
ncbi:hypothetical protein [Limnospira maxima]|uniref:Glycosyltransferase RgtA/B/C/D-like domain-containing protein n=1 Tax=Limnospira maxima CS-328 TaxID=513049 RepID=B5VX93_LIMMA|nr:hypothetical protein [Limnospira maxima]AMW31714.1 hypothetical protein AP285_17775 [Arthrospira platensis YZ]EDZ96098.1 hypothetical protein AmaxDRAFT_1135 [Limnospira maxima CS-328]MDC0838270.1 hypothetical protein [Limnoraphis robusta]